MKELRAACIDADARNERIFERLFSQSFMNSESFFVYLSFGNEVDTKRIIQELLLRNKAVYVPRVRGRSMSLVRYTGQALTAGAFGIEEAEGESESVVPEVCLTPLLAADRRCARLGFGGGFYDSWFADKQIYKAGLAFSFQIIESVPVESTDVFLDAVVTDRETIYRR